MNGTSTSKRSTIMIVLLVVAVIGLIVDLKDGHLPKTLVSVGVCIGLAALIMAQRSSAMVWRIIGLAGIALAIGALVYRLVTYSLT